MRKILITGCAGFLGSQVSKILCENSFKVYGIDNLSSGDIKNLPKSKNFSFKKIDCSKSEELNKINIKFDILIHFCGQASSEKSYLNPYRDFQDNILSTINLLEFIKKKKCNKIIFASSMAVYGNTKKLPVRENDQCNPVSFYGLNKLICEKYINFYSKKFKKKYTILRFFNVYGPGQKLNNLKQGMLRIYLQQIFKQKKLHIKGSLNRMRDFIYIEDVSGLLIEIINKNKFYNNIYNIGSGIKYKVKDILRIIKEEINFNFKITVSDSTPTDIFKIYPSISKAKKDLNFYPKNSLKIGIRKFIKHLKNN